MQLCRIKIIIMFKLIEEFKFSNLLGVPFLERITLKYICIIVFSKFGFNKL